MKTTHLAGVGVGVFLTLAGVGMMSASPRPAESSTYQKISTRAAESSIRKFYDELRFTINEGDINTDISHKKEWMDVTVEGMKMPNEPQKLNFLWKQGMSADAEYISASLYFECYARARDGKLTRFDYKLTASPKPLEKPDLRGETQRDFDYYTATVAKQMRINGALVEIEDEVSVKAENGRVSHILNRCGGYQPQVAATIQQSEDVILQADLAYSHGEYGKAYRLYRDLVKSGVIAQAKTVEADACYRLAIMLYYHWHDCDASVSKKERKRLLSAYLTRAREVGGYHIREKARRALYYMENG